MTGVVPPLDPRIDHERMTLAMHRTLGGGPATLVTLAGYRRSLRLAERGLVLTAGDNQKPLALDDLLPMARREQASLLGGYIDPHKNGHRFFFDVVAHRDGRFRLLPACRLWLPKAGWPWLIPDHGPDAVTITWRKVIVTDRRPWFDQLGRTVGFTRGLTALWSILGVTPDDHWADY